MAEHKPMLLPMRAETMFPFAMSPFALSLSKGSSLQHSRMESKPPSLVTSPKSLSPRCAKHAKVRAGNFLSVQSKKLMILISSLCVLGAPWREIFSGSERSLPRSSPRQKCLSPRCIKHAKLGIKNFFSAQSEKLSILTSSLGVLRAPWRETLPNPHEIPPFALSLSKGS